MASVITAATIVKIETCLKAGFEVRMIRRYQNGNNLTALTTFGNVAGTTSYMNYDVTLAISGKADFETNLRNMIHSKYSWIWEKS
jgi:hypothetical protein